MSLNAISDNATRLLNSYVAIPDTTTRMPSSPFLLGGFTFAAFVVTTLYTRQSSKGDQVPYKYGAPFVGSWAFFTRRYYFISDSLKRFGGKFRFSILQVSPARTSRVYTSIDVFPSTKSLSLLEKKRARYSTATGISV
jgi:hypothetical protein